MTNLNSENARRIKAFARRFGGDVDAAMNYAIANFFKREPLPLEDENPEQAAAQEMLTRMMQESREARIYGPNYRFEKGAKQ